MTCYTGSIAAVPKANREAYLAHAAASWAIFRKYGARRMVESWGVDVPKGEVNDLYGAVKAQEDEAIVFSWIEWDDNASAIAAWKQMEADPEMKALPAMPFDGTRMIFGNFTPIFADGTSKCASYLQGFTLAVPTANRAAYQAMAQDAWEKMFQPKGCLGIMEGWAEDVPHGRETDFYRATLAKECEVPLFSWTAWPDRASCDAASAQMQAEAPPPGGFDLPFDGMRMIWGGFEIVFDSSKL